MFRSRSVAQFLAGCLIIPLLLVACGGSASPTVADAQDPTAVTRTAPTETPQLQPSPTAPPEATPTPESTATPSPAPTSTTEPSPTASPTLEPTVTSTPEEPAAIDAGQIEATLNGLLVEAGGYVAVAVKTADGQILYEHESDESMEAASIYKLPVMVEVYRQIEEGNLDLSTGVLLTPSFFNEGEDSIGWGSVNSYYDIETLLFAMIAQSSNVAAYALLDLVGNDNVNATMADLGLESIEIRWSPRYVPPEDLFPGPADDFEETSPDFEEEYVEEPEPEEPEEEVENDEEDQSEDEPVEEEVPEDVPADDEDADDSGNGLATFMSLQAPGIVPTLRADAAFNVVTARAIADLLLLIAKGEAISAGASEQMLNLLQQQQIPGGLPAQVPDGVVAHKTGYLEDGVFNDAGIVQTGLGPIVVVVLTEDVREDIAYQIMSEAGRLVYELGTAN